MTTLADLHTMLSAAVVELPATDLADAVGACAAAQARLLARLTMPAPTPATGSTSMTARQLADVFEVPVSQIYEQARQGRIPCVRLGKYRRFDLAAVRQALADGSGSKTVELGARKNRRKSRGLESAATTLQPPRDVARA